MPNKANKDRGKPIRVGRFIVGYVRGDTFYKTISGSRHFKRTPAGIANDVSVINDVLNAGACWVEVTDRETGKVYRTSIELINSMGIHFNEGFGNQINLLFEYWIVSFEMNSKAPRPGEVKFRQGNGLHTRNQKGEFKPTPRQMLLFGGQ